MPSLATARELHEIFNFRVDFPGGEKVFFRSCGPIEASFNTVQYREAGSALVIKAPESVEFADVTLERGASRSPVLYTWFKDTANALLGFSQGAPVPRTYVRTVKIYQLGRDKKPLKTYTLFEVFPVAFRAGSWDNAADEVVIEALTLTYRYLTVKFN